MEQVSFILKQEAISKGLCTQWAEEWGENETNQSLIDKYKKGIDFAIEKDYPSVEFIKSNFSEDLLNMNLIYVDQKENIKRGSGVYIFNGDCDCELSFDGFEVATIYVRHGSKIRVNVKGNAKVFISLFDNSFVEIESIDNSKSYIYRRSNNCISVSNGNVLERGENNLRL